MPTARAASALPIRRLRPAADRTRPRGDREPDPAACRSAAAEHRRGCPPGGQRRLGGRCRRSRLPVVPTWSGASGPIETFQCASQCASTVMPVYTRRGGECYASAGNRLDHPPAITRPGAIGKAPRSGRGSTFRPRSDGGSGRKRVVQPAPDRSGRLRTGNRTERLERLGTEWRQWNGGNGIDPTAAAAENGGCSGSSESPGSPGSAGAQGAGAPMRR